ncbi:hypothetical protein RDI58_002030 [Solanum bulbocastanum]|uniref:CCHC-type domain-containing protein n=1 Tax=Solanum bulbocastanum TaxID=147425 RepID=A0AAN8UFC7_SOLBU
MESLAMYSSRAARPPHFNNNRHPYPIRNLYCDFCNMKRHVRADCNKLKKCDNCNATGHVKDNCYLLIGYPDNFKGKKKVNTVMGDCTNSQRQMQNMQDHMEWKAHTAMGEQSPGGNQVTQEQLLQMMQNSSPTQLNQIFNVLNESNKMMEDLHKGAYMAGNPTSTSTSTSSLKWIIDTGLPTI